MLGLDLLGLGSKNWPIKEAINAFPQGWGLGVFDTTFGDVIPKAKLMLDSGKVPAIRVHLWYDASHKIVPMDVLSKRAPLWEKLAKQYPDIKFYVSHSCEYSEKNIAEIKKRLDLVIKLCPSCIPVQSPMHSPVIKGYKTEQHGSSARAKKGELVSTDGNEIQQMASAVWVERQALADIIFLWGARFNLRESGTTEPPKERTAYPDARYINGIVRLGHPKGPVPTPTFSNPVTPLKKPNLWKSYSEDHVGVDPRANKPVVMLPEKAPFLEVITFNGKLVAKFPLYPDKNPHKLERYYSGVPKGPNLFAYEIGDKAKQLSGYEWVWLRIKNKYYGPLCAPFRTGYAHQ